MGDTIPVSFLFFISFLTRVFSVHKDNFEHLSDKPLITENISHGQIKVRTSLIFHCTYST